MKTRIGTLLMLLGTGLVVAALALLLNNQREQLDAAASSQAVMPELVQSIQARQMELKEQAAQDDPLAPSDAVPAVGYEKKTREMTVTEINGYSYIGFLAIPSLELELPVMADWSYPQLQVAPCRYTGNVYNDDLVVMAHNYQSHFGRLDTLDPGDEVIFTDMDGNMFHFEVIALEVLDPTHIEDFVSGEFDLTLFTCTYGGQSRVTVRCDRVEE